MRLVITEKNDASRQISRLLSDSGAPKQDKVYNVPVWRFRRDGDDWVTIGLKGHILEPDFPEELRFDSDEGWFAVDDEGEVLPADLPDGLARPPYATKRKPFLEDGVSLKGWKMDSLPYLVWSPVEKRPAEKQIIRALKNLAAKADDVIVATDYDREGELIGSDALAQVREVAPDIPASRARYSAYTRAEIEHAFENLVEVDEDLAAAGESRQHIDLIWGAVLTRYLTVARRGGFGNVRSAGRVQTPTLALVVERERERMAFVPEDYWVIDGKAAKRGAGEADAFAISHAKGRFKDEAAARAAFAKVEGATEGTVTGIERRSRSQRPPAPFNTTSLQAAAASIGIAPGRAMRIAESLYMDGLISYPRVDNTVYPSSLDLRGTVKMLQKVPAYAPACAEILSEPHLKPTRGKQQSTDHPPIYPTAAASKDRLSGQEWRLYDLVARRFLATLMGPATIEGTTVEIDVAGEPFRARGDVLKVPGYRAAYPFGLKRDEQLPPLVEGEMLDVSAMGLQAKQTEPPARYSQGRLIQEMEKRGLGTKSTRASIIDRLIEVNYLKDDPLVPSQLGIAIIDALDAYAPRITTPTMTSDLEESMDRVSEGHETEAFVVDKSRQLLANQLDALIEHQGDLGEAIADAVTADARVGACPKCGKDLVVKNSPKNRSRFIGCTGWPDCDVTYPVPNGRLEATDRTCPECGAPILKVRPFRGKPYEVCVNPRCATNLEPDLVVGECPVCAEKGAHAHLVAHKSETSGKRFIRCENYEDCGTSYPLPARGQLRATGETCPECGAPLVEVQTDRGPWKLCPNPECPAQERRRERRQKRGRSRTGGRAARKRG